LFWLKFWFSENKPFFSRCVNSETAGLKQGKKLSGEAPSPGSRPWFVKIFQKISPACQNQNCKFFAVVWVGVDLADLMRQIATALFAAG